jgi:hypothetical protein
VLRTQSVAKNKKHLDRWIGGYARHLARRMTSARPSGPTHVMFCVCDHFEPLWGGASESVGRDRVRRWLEDYPKLARNFRDADGRMPRHSFFFPGEQYRPHFLHSLAELARAGLGEVEFHLHHDADNAENLRRDLLAYLGSFAEHGHLSRDAFGNPRFAFIHGNWCLANSRRDGRYCGVDNELEVLFETGCYADFTFPSAPDETQPNIVNQIYWPAGDPSQARAHETGIRARVGEVLHDRILVVQGPLALTKRAKRLGVRIESAALSARDPARPERVRAWISQRIHIQGRPEWVFVKVHTHGAPEDNASAYLGDGGRSLFAELVANYNDQSAYILHFVTAREMFNIALAGMEGKQGNPGDYRDYALRPPPVMS